MFHLRDVYVLVSNGVADINELKEKYPERSRLLPESVMCGEALHSMSGLRDELKNLVSGKAPGCGGLRPEYLSMIGRIMIKKNQSKVEP